jgi:hypothetical protein
MAVVAAMHAAEPDLTQPEAMDEGWTTMRRPAESDGGEYICI